jgi:anti-sigma factor RsiW
MDALLRNLENESLLLLYLVGELPEEDRLELDVLLATDGGLRSQLQELRAAQAAALSALGQLDASEPLRSPESTVRQVSRAMRQRQVERLARPAIQPAAKRRMPIWVYPLATAAMILVGFCFWWGSRAETTTASTQPAYSSIQGGLANGGPTASPDDLHAEDRAHASTALVTLDSTSQGLADLEKAVGDDLQ